MTPAEELTRLQEELQKAQAQYRSLLDQAKQVRDVCLRIEGGIVTLRALEEKPAEEPEETPDET